MLKNSTKITSLLVAAASMATMVPAMAADKIADKDGNIYRAIAYKDGKFYVDGDDIENAGGEDGVFWLNGGKHDEVDSDVDSGDAITGVYGEKYVEIEDGDYYFDLSTGKVTDDQLVNDDREDAASELAKKVRKDDPDRYDENTRDDKAQVTYNKNTNSNSYYEGSTAERTNEIWEVPGAPYNKPYYETQYLKFASDKGDHVVADNTLVKATYATVYTDEKGTYVDADNDLGKVNVIINKNINRYTTTADAFIMDPDTRVNQAETLEFSEVGDKKNKDKSAQVDMYIEHITTIGQDEKNVYRLAALHVKFTNLLAKNAGRPVSEYEHVIQEGEYVTFGSTKNPVLVQASDDGRFYVIQKISKETDGDKDDANLPKTTETYLACENKDWKKKGGYKVKTTDDAAFLSTEEGKGYIAAGEEDVVEDGNVVTKYKFVKPDGAVVTNPKDDDRTVWKNGDFATSYFGDFKYTIADGKVTKYQYGFETLNDNGSADNDHEDEKFIVKTFSLKKSNGMYYIDADKNDDDFDDEDEFATTIDKDGNIWKLDSGKIYKYKNDGDYELKYKCDGGLNELSVYDDNNLIAYNEDDDVYAIVGGKSSTGKYEVEDENKTTTTTTAQVGWYTNADGSWSYGNADGTKAIGWLQSPTSGLWYYMDANGIMMSNGWVQDGAYWYFLGADGAMKTGWVYTGGAWYYLKETAGNKGAMQTGWIQTGGKWYYCNASGAMLSNTTVNGYKLGADGAWIK